jgi:integrase/recombinase XerD
MAYRFNEDIEARLGLFERYLRSKQYSAPTIRQLRNYAGLYLEWLEEQGAAAQQVDYRRFMDFVFYLTGRQVQLNLPDRQTGEKNTLNFSRRVLLAVRHYYQSLGDEHNPAAGIYLRGKRQSILNDVVPYDELLDLYGSYPILDDRTRRNKVIMGLLIYQGLRSGELNRLECSHVRIREGKIHVPGHGKSNSRVLDLQAAQLLELQEYLQVVRPRMLENLHAYRPGRKPQTIDPVIHERLFFSEGGSHCIKSSLFNLFRAVRRTHPNIRSPKVIRSTVIAEWLKSRDVRLVQYMAGHRWVSSTERYNVYNLQELKEALDKYHPLTDRSSSPDEV